MSDREQQGHWDSLVNQLGADPQLRPPAKKLPQKPAAEGEKRPAPIPSVRPTTTDWTDVAKHLGVAVAEPLAADAIRWRKTEPAQPSVGKATARAVEEVRAVEKPPAAPTPAASQDAAEVRDFTGVERSRATANMAVDGFGAGLFEGVEAVAAGSPEWLEEAEEEVADKPRKRRKRRGRSKSSRLKETEEADAAADKQAEPRDGAGETDATADAPDEEESPRPRRRKRRRKAKSAQREPGEAERAEDDSVAAKATRPAAAKQDDADDDDDDDDNLDPKASGSSKPREAAHRNIPSWDEAVGMIVTKNLESRSKSPGRSSGRPRGRGRGRGRSSDSTK